jgi:hypothetical protein
MIYISNYFAYRIITFCDAHFQESSAIKKYIDSALQITEIFVLQHLYYNGLSFKNKVKISPKTNKFNIQHNIGLGCSAFARHY